MKRTLAIARLHTVNLAMLLGWPVSILALVFAVNYAIYVLISSVTPADARVTGALASIYCVVGVAHLQSITQMFGFALGLGVTRRAFFQATALVIALQAAVFGTLITLLAALERVTGGWGISMQFFTFPFLRAGNPLLQWLVYTVPFVALSALGVLIGVIVKRWGPTGLFVAGIASFLALAGAAALITVRAWWPAVGAFLAGSSPTALFAGYPLVFALLAGALGLAALRRATP